MFNRHKKRERPKAHRSYTVDEAAKTLGVVKPTIRRWIKVGGLAALTDRKPWLIQGADLEDFLKSARAPRQSCKLEECYCVRCRRPRRPACDMVEYIPLTHTGGNLRALCPVCEAFMHKRVSLVTLDALKGTLDVSIRVEALSLEDRGEAPLNVNLE